MSLQRHLNDPILEWWNPVAVFEALIGSETAVNAVLNFLWHFGIDWELLWIA